MSLLLSYEQVLLVLNGHVHLAGEGLHLSHQFGSLLSIHLITILLKDLVIHLTEEMNQIIDSSELLILEQGIDKLLEGDPHVLTRSGAFQSTILLVLDEGRHHILREHSQVVVSEFHEVGFTSSHQPLERL